MPQLKFSIQKQGCSQWCWAAVSASVAAFYGSPQPLPLQCQLANRVILPGKDCCQDCNCSSSSGVDEPCDRPADIDVGLNAVGHDRGDGGIPGSATSFALIRKEIDASRPVAVRIDWDGSPDSHGVVICGYTLDGLVFVADPMIPDTIKTYSFDNFKYPSPQGSGNGSWGETFRTRP